MLIELPGTTTEITKGEYLITKGPGSKKIEEASMRDRILPFSVRRIQDGSPEDQSIPIICSCESITKLRKLDTCGVYLVILAGEIVGPHQNTYKIPDGYNPVTETGIMLVS